MKLIMRKTLIKAMRKKVEIVDEIDNEKKVKKSEKNPKKGGKIH